MYEQRSFNQAELLTWCRYLTIGLLGSALAYARERTGSSQDFVDFTVQQLTGALGGAPGGAPDSAMLGLLLNLEALGLSVHSRQIGPEQGEAVVESLPGAGVCAELERHFEVVVSPGELLELVNLDAGELNQALDIIGRAIAEASGLEYCRATVREGERLTLRVW